MSVPSSTRPEARTLRFLGAAGTVTGSKFLVGVGSSKVLVDCGLYQGVKALRERNWVDLPVPATEIDAIVVTHAHIDHCGYLPRLVAQGFDGPVYATRRTCQLAEIVLPDCGHLAEEEAEYANRKGYSKHDPALALFTEEDAWAATSHLHPIAVGATIPIAPGVDVTLSRAGHILGAASATVHLNGAGRGDATIGFSGDLGRPAHPLLVAPDPAPDVDQLVVESTYGDRVHDDVDGPATLATTIRRTIERGGSVIIPAFAVDRTEVLLHHLAALCATGELPADLPVYVDSPMALAALHVYRSAIADGDPDIDPHVRGTDPFAVPGLVEVRDVEGSKALNHPDRPCVIVSAAGMASGGRVVHHLAAALPDRRNCVILAGYQAIGTRGRRLLEGATELKMVGRYIPVRADVVNLPQFSVHADRDELVDWVGSAARRPETVYVVHGEPAAAQSLADAIRQRLDLTAVVARDGERVVVGRSG